MYCHDCLGKMGSLGQRFTDMIALGIWALWEVYCHDCLGNVDSLGQRCIVMIALVMWTLWGRGLLK